MILTEEGVQPSDENKSLTSSSPHWKDKLPTNSVLPGMECGHHVKWRQWNGMGTLQLDSGSPSAALFSSFVAYLGVLYTMVKTLNFHKFHGDP